MGISLGSVSPRSRRLPEWNITATTSADAT
ncbi:unnamed protein product [Cuscuta europaea]|uniref:Uncharacterized protein n=1 Tax=Cuscuta europaea TaxID=41803 RepID=A0A9P0Z5J0_CUSEU|nr:unnamed protein product [Cuscuta europaea]